RRMRKMHAHVPASVRPLVRRDRGLALAEDLGQDVDHAPRRMFIADRNMGAVRGRGEGGGVHRVRTGEIPDNLDWVDGRQINLHRRGDLPMPFTETCRMEERVRMLADYATGNWSVSELCQRYGVCRDTFYEWRRRRDSGAADWFTDRSHAPLHCPHETDAALKDAIIALRRRFPHLGPRKLLSKLKRQAPEIGWPAASTAGEILRQAGLITAV